MVPDGPSTRANPARGIVLIATALVLGLFVLRQGFETVDVSAAGSSSGAQEQSGTPAEGSEGSVDEAAGNGEGDSGEAAAEPEPEPLQDPSELTVRVINTTSSVGTAANWSCSLRDDGGYISDPGQATNLAGDRDQRPQTTVMYAEGLEGEAAELAEKVGLDVGVEPAPAEPLTDPAGAPLMTEGVQFLVLLGTDLAGNEPSVCEG